MLLYTKIKSVVGGSDSAGKDALVLSKHAKKVYIIYRGEKIHPEPVNLDKIMKTKNIEIINNTNITEIKGEDRVREIVLDKKFNGSNILNVDAVFVAIGHEVLSELAEKLGVKINEKKEIIINHKTSETNVPGVFAAGDVTDKQFKQLITGVADACTAAYSAYEYLGRGKLEC
jgi:thioredoxin reductase (NADPH)